MSAASTTQVRSAVKKLTMNGVGVGSISSWVLCRRRSAAFSMTPGSFEIATVNVAGVFTRMFCCDSAPASWMSMGIGVRSSHA